MCGLIHPKPNRDTEAVYIEALFSVKDADDLLRIATDDLENFDTTEAITAINEARSLIRHALTAIGLDTLDLEAIGLDTPGGICPDCHGTDTEPGYALHDPPQACQACR